MQKKFRNKDPEKKRVSGIQNTSGLQQGRVHAHLQEGGGSLYSNGGLLADVWRVGERLPVGGFY